MAYPQRLAPEAHSLTERFIENNPSYTGMPSQTESKPPHHYLSVAELMPSSQLSRQGRSDHITPLAESKIPPKATVITCDDSQDKSLAELMDVCREAQSNLRRVSKNRRFPAIV